MGSYSWNSFVLLYLPSLWSSWPQWTVGSSVMEPSRWQHLAGLGYCSPGCGVYSELATKVWCCLPQLHEFRGGKAPSKSPLMVVILLFFFYSLLPIPDNFGLCWFRGLGSQARNVSTKEENNGFIKLEVETLLPGLFIPVNQQITEGLTVWVQQR